jgi:hypothetical protein
MQQKHHEQDRRGCSQQGFRMTLDEKIRKLRKELTFLNARMRAWEDNLRVLRRGSVRVIIGGLASPHMSHHMYLGKRHERVMLELDRCMREEAAHAL